MKRANIRVRGLVQGVFFRLNAKKIALDLGLKGYARNMPDGSLEIIVEGPKGRIDELIEFCKKGPEAAEVSRINVRFENPKNEFDGFEIRR